MKLLLAIALATGWITPALAAEDCQFDLLLGGVWGQSQHTQANGATLTDKFDLRGSAAGAGFGCTWAARGRWVTGFAADWMHTTGNGHAQELAPNTNFTSETDFDWVSTLRLVAGYRNGPGTLYVTAGGAASPVKAKVCPTGATNINCAIQSQTLYGVVGGFGAKWQLAKHWSVRSELLFFGFEKRGFLDPPPAGFADRGGGLEPELRLARVGLSFHF
jgi:opacity protein-like surface antigen